MICAHCNAAQAIGILTVAGQQPQPVCRPCGLESQKRAHGQGLQATVEEMKPEPMTAPPHWGQRP